MNAYLNDYPQVTFGKSIYKRYTKMSCWKQSYTLGLESNFLDLTETIALQPNPVIIKEIWLKKSPELSQQTSISLILVPEYEVDHQFLLGINPFDDFINRLDAQPINVEGIIDWQFLDEFENIGLKEPDPNLNLPELEKENLIKTSIDPNSTLGDILSKKNTYLLSKLSIQTIQMLNGYLSRDYGNYLSIPVPINAMVFNLIKKSKYRLYIHVDQVANPIDLTIKYIKLQNEDEVRRFNEQAHEYLIKRYIEVDELINPTHPTNPTHTIKCNYTNMQLAGVIVYSEKKLSSIKIKDKDGIEYWLTESTSNPENSHVPAQGFYYVATQLEESQSYLWNKLQPVGSYVIDPSDLIDFGLGSESGSEQINIKITYVLYDVLRYYPKNFIEMVSYSNVFAQEFNTVSNDKFNELVHQEEKITKDQFIEHFYSWASQCKLTKPIDHFYMDMQVPIHPIPSFGKYERAHREQFPPAPDPDDPANPVDPLGFGGLQLGDIWVGGYSNPSSKLTRLIQLNEQVVINAIKWLVRSKEHITLSLGPLEPGTICEISLDLIKPFESYYSCPTCSGNFKSDIYRTWIEDHTKSGKCPKCQEKISTMPKLKLNISFSQIIGYVGCVCLLGLACSLIGMI